MLENLKKILNEDQDPKSIDKITAKLENLLMSNEDIGYIAVQKKPAVTILPDSIVVTNKRIILCKPKNLGLSMEFVDYDWHDITGSFVKEGILGADFTFTTKSDLTYTIDYLPKNQARKLYTFAKEQLEILKNPVIKEVDKEESSVSAIEFVSEDVVFKNKESEKIVLEEIKSEEVFDFAEIIPVNEQIIRYEEARVDNSVDLGSERKLSELSQDELFEKLQNYKRLLDNGLILQGEYDSFKKEILTYM
ncbi:hypothetical protein SY27_08820 [Flavobacterium sp. 316]|uniref:PH domain-containing protein n=1 Tax=Flavobacterium sp. 316 TaxID=1603293 RepID=UPI0005DD755D|nr:PH domain-containing protein [Flavobacterium sp. 316]KIX21768.1 hypothetical protein SY27_08820 [Flavobacterium sp. 316]